MRKYYRCAFFVIAIILCFVLSGCRYSSNYFKYDENALEQDNTMEQDNAIQNYDDADEFFYCEPENSPESLSIKIFKSKRQLELYGDDNIIGRFKIGLGGNPSGDKNKEGDRKTPVGEYYICTRNQESPFHLFLGVSYPNTEDAQRGFENNIIDENTLKIIKRAEENKQLPPWDTPLGGAIGIHGGGNKSDWTLGCIAMTNEDIEIIWKSAKLQTPVFIYE